MNPDDPQAAPQPTPPPSLSPDQLPDPPPPVSDSPVSLEKDPAPVSGGAVAAPPASGAVPGSRTAQLLREINAQVRGVFLGQDDVVAQALAALIAGGHVLLEGKPGLGKTHLVLALARAFGVDFGRIQFTPDLMPSDVAGHTLYDMGSGEFKVRRGPVFTNLLLADEINRAPAKTQSALLEVMQELQVTIDGDSMKLAPPFMVFATQNPIEQEGTYPLPEAQLDRFLMKVLIDYPTAEDEGEIVSRASAAAGGRGLDPAAVSQVCSAEEILQAQRDAAAIRAVDDVVRYAVNITRATRESQSISLGAGTRGAIALIRVAKAYAVINGRTFITPDDVKSAALPVLRHRVAIAPELAISGQTVDDTLLGILRTVEAPRG